ARGIGVVVLYRGRVGIAQLHLQVEQRVAGKAVLVAGDDGPVVDQAVDKTEGRHHRAAAGGRQRRIVDVRAPVLVREPQGLVLAQVPSSLQQARNRLAAGGQNRRAIARAIVVGGAEIQRREGF